MVVWMDLRRATVRRGAGKRRLLHVRKHPGGENHRLNLRTIAFCWTHQGHRKVATFVHLAANKGWQTQTKRRKENREKEARGDERRTGAGERRKEDK